MPVSTTPTITAAQDEALQALQLALARASQTGLLDSMAPSLSHPDLAQAFAAQAHAFAESNAVQAAPASRGSDGKVVSTENIASREASQELVLYHGSAESFEAFRSELVGTRHADIIRDECEDESLEPTAFYFTNDLETAIWYAKSSAEKLGKPAVDGVVISVSLSITNPKEVDFQGTGRETLGEELAAAKRNGNDGLICLDYDDGGVSDHYVVFDPSKINILKTETVHDLTLQRVAESGPKQEMPSMQW